MDGRPAPDGLRAGLDADIAPVDEALEVMPGHVGMQREGGGHLSGRDSGFGADVQEDVTARRIAERRRHGSDGGTEPAVVRPGRSLGHHRDRSGAHGR